MRRFVDNTTHKITIRTLKSGIIPSPSKICLDILCRKTMHFQQVTPVVVTLAERLGTNLTLDGRHFDKKLILEYLLKYERVFGLKIVKKIKGDMTSCQTLPSKRYDFREVI